MSYRSVFRLLIASVLLAATVFGQENINPAGTAVAVRYTLSTTSLAVGDTLIITRTLVNRTSATLTGLYFSDNLPPTFTVVRQTIRLNGTAISSSQAGPMSGALVTGYNYYLWVVDSPVPTAIPQRAIGSGDSVALELKIICSVAGSFILPLHSTVCYTGGTGIFATSTALIVTYFQPVDSIPPSAIRDLGDHTAYKGHKSVLRVWSPGYAPRPDKELNG